MIKFNIRTPNSKQWKKGKAFQLYRQKLIEGQQRIWKEWVIYLSKGIIEGNTVAIFLSVNKHSITVKEQCLWDSWCLGRKARHSAAILEYSLGSLYSSPTWKSPDGWFQQGGLASSIGYGDGRRNSRYSTSLRQENGLRRTRRGGGDHPQSHLRRNQENLSLPPSLLLLHRLVEKDKDKEVGFHSFIWLLVTV